MFLSKNSKYITGNKSEKMSFEPKSLMTAFHTPKYASYYKIIRLESTAYGIFRKLCYSNVISSTAHTHTMHIFNLTKTMHIQSIESIRAYVLCQTNTCTHIDTNRHK